MSNDPKNGSMLPHRAYMGALRALQNPSFLPGELKIAEQNPDEFERFVAERFHDLIVEFSSRVAAGEKAA